MDHRGHVLEHPIVIPHIKFEINNRWETILFCSSKWRDDSWEIMLLVRFKVGFFL